MATRRFGVATAKLEWWARLRANAQARRAVSKLGLGLSGENHSAKTNLTTEPIAAPPTLAFYPRNGIILPVIPPSKLWEA
ncbi:hypothetical protein DQM23_13645 [Lacticaseibacillus paracasei]|nr:hypothetical protein DQM23_13645 [Lacticaseibacillus paracasei]